MSIAEFYLMNSRYYNGFDMELDIYNPFDDDYDHHSLIDSDWSDCFGSPDCRSYVGLMEICLLPHFFPDCKKFHNEWMRQVLLIQSNNNYPLTKLPVHESISEKLELPLFEQLWECLFYLKEIFSVGMLRVESTSVSFDDDSEMAQEIWKRSIECFSSFPKETQESFDCWFNWVNDILIDSIQSHIPVSLPYIAWISIIRHLSKVKYSENRTLTSKIGTISRYKEYQMTERVIIRKCILSICDIITFLYQFLFSEINITTNIVTIKHAFSTLFRGFSHCMERFSHFLRASESNTKFLDYAGVNNFSTELSSLVNKNDSYKEAANTFDLLKTVMSCSIYQNNNDYFSLLIPENEKKGIFHLLCFNKDSIEDSENLDCFIVLNALQSEKPPQIFCSGNFLACLSSDNTDDFELSVWNVPGKTKLFHLKEVMRGWKEFISEACAMSSSNIKLRGIMECKTELLIIFHISNSSCIISKYENKAAQSSSGKNLHLLENNIPLGVYKSSVLLMDIQDQQLIMMDLKDPDDWHITCKTSFKCGDDWRMQCDSSPNSDLCILYQSNSLQLRRLDNNLTLLKEFKIDLESSIPHSDKLEIHFFDNLIYGIINKEDLPLTINEYLKQTEEKDRTKSFAFEKFLQERFENKNDVFFIIDSDAVENGPLYLNWKKPFCYTSFDAVNGNIPDSTDLEVFMTGFNKKGDLVKLSVNFDMNECLLDKDGANCMSSVVSFGSTNVFFTFGQSQDEILKSVHQVSELLEKEEEKNAEMIRVQKEYKKKMEFEQQKRKEALEKLKEEVENYIKCKTYVKVIISKWMHAEGYGFAKLKLQAGDQDVFVHKTCVTGKDRKHLHSGTALQCQLEWDSNHPRPKAANVKLL